MATEGPWNGARVLAAALGALPAMRVFPTALLQLISAHLDYVHLILAARSTDLASCAYVAFSPGAAFDSTPPKHLRAISPRRRVVAAPSSIVPLAAPLPPSGILAQVGNDRYRIVEDEHKVSFSWEGGRFRGVKETSGRRSAMRGDSLALLYDWIPGPASLERSVLPRLLSATKESEEEEEEEEEEDDDDDDHIPALLEREDKKVWTGPVPHSRTVSTTRNRVVNFRQRRDGTTLAWRGGNVVVLQSVPAASATTVDDDVEEDDDETPAPNGLGVANTKSAQHGGGSGGGGGGDCAWRVVEEITLPPLWTFGYICLPTPQVCSLSPAANTSMCAIPEGAAVEHTLVVVHARCLNVYCAPLPSASAVAPEKPTERVANVWRTASVPGFAGAGQAERALITRAIGLRVCFSDASSDAPRAAVLVYGDCPSHSYPVPQLYDVVCGRWHARPRWALPEASRSCITEIAEADGWLLLTSKPLGEFKPTQLFVLDTAHAVAGWHLVDAPNLGVVLCHRLIRALSRERRLATDAGYQ